MASRRDRGCLGISRVTRLRGYGRQGSGCIRREARCRRAVRRRSRKRSKKLCECLRKLILDIYINILMIC